MKKRRLTRHFPGPLNNKRRQIEMSTSTTPSDASLAPLGARHAANITLNGKTIQNENDVNTELKRKGHDLMCPLSAFSTWSPILSTRGCVKSFGGLDGNTKYTSCRSEELAHRLHVEKMENGVLDLEPLAPAAKGVYFAGLGVFLNALRAWRQP